MKPLRPLTKVEIIERSIECFQLGLMSLLPLIGLPMAVQSLVHYFRVRLDKSGQLDPAQDTLKCGARLALAGILEAAFVFAAIGTIVLIKLLDSRP